jgi:hypothetical protein
MLPGFIIPIIIILITTPSEPEIREDTIIDSQFMLYLLM